MARKLENRSISFDGELFEAMEEYRGKHLVSRSEFVQRCVQKYLIEVRKAKNSKTEAEDDEQPSIRKSVPYSRSKR